MKERRYLHQISLSQDDRCQSDTALGIVDISPVVAYYLGMPLSFLTLDRSQDVSFMHFVMSHVEFSLLNIHN